MSEPDHAIHSQLSHQAGSLQALARCLVNESFKGDAEDFVQDTFVTALSQDTKPRQLHPWLRQVLRNKVRDHARQYQRRGELRQQFLELPISPPFDESTDFSTLVDSLHDVLSQLDEPYRETLQLRFFQDRTTTEIAHRMHCPPGTVRWRIHEGLQRMRRDLDRRFGDRNLWCSPVASLASLLSELRQNVSPPIQPSPPPTPKLSKNQSPQPCPPKELTMKSLLFTIATTTVLSSGLTALAYESRSNEKKNDMQGISASQSAKNARTVAVSGPTIAKRPASPAAILPNFSCPSQESAKSSSENKWPNSPISDHCDDLIAEAQSQGSFEIEVIIEGGPSNAGNQVAHVSVLRGSAKCLNGPQGPHTEQDASLAALASCVRNSFNAGWFEPPLPQGGWTCEVRPFTSDPDQKIGPRGGFVLRRFEPPASKDEDGQSCCNGPLPPPRLPNGGLGAQQAGVHFDAPRVGAAPDAPLTVIVCASYGNERSNMARATMSQLAADFPSEVATYWIHNPDPNTDGIFASRFAIAAQAQGKFWEAHALVSEHIFDNLTDFEQAVSNLDLDLEKIKEDMSSTKTNQAIADQRAFCLQYHAYAKPSFIINGEVLEGLPAYRELREKVDAALSKVRQ